jgi:GT2 family glycosyltransferase
MRLLSNKNNKMKKKYEFTLVILTYNRPERVQMHLEYLAHLSRTDLEVIFVDNCSEVRVSSLVPNGRYTVVRNETNLGAVGRNRGIEAACGDIVITLDDDVYGITDQHLDSLREVMKQPNIAAVNFHIREEDTGRIANWCHPYDGEKFCYQSFETNGISEGAVAFRRTALAQVGLYPDYFFISHEGPDLACRLINAGWRLIYSPDVVVTHAYEQRGRAGWRRYYYDTRNLLWLVLRNFSLWSGLKQLFIGWGSMLVYSIRDGYLRFWFKAVWDSFLGIPRALRDRVPLTAAAKKQWLQIEKHRLSFWKMAKKRLISRDVRI